MHVPNPLGSYPLTLRNSNTSNPRRGELLFDYENYDIYYIDKNTGIKSNLAKDIYDKIIASKLENTHILLCQTDGEGTEDDLPYISDRKPNTFYYNIYKREETA